MSSGFIIIRGQCDNSVNSMSRGANDTEHLKEFVMPEIVYKS